MKAVDLRLGNLVKGRRRQVTQIILHDLNLMLEWEITKYSRTPPIKSIPLTEEWLLKFGFAYSDKGFFWKNWGINGVQIVEFDTGYKKYRFELGQYNYKVLDHVHQLQNLYFALTGEELTIIL